MPAVVWILIALVVGTLPSPYLIALIARRPDLIAEMRREESPGDAHFLVVKGMGRAPGIAAIVLDMIKGFVPALLAVRSHDIGDWGIAAVGIAAVVGHSFAPFIRRAGGRGLTTAA